MIDFYPKTVYILDLTFQKVCYFGLVNNEKSEFVENLIFYRTQKKLSQLDLSGICDCGKSTISGIEAGKTNPSFDLIYRLADALEIHPADLFLRNASQNREDVRKFFDEELSPKVQEMVEKRFPTAEDKE